MLDVVSLHFYWKTIKMVTDCSRRLTGCSIKSTSFAHILLIQMDLRIAACFAHFGWFHRLSSPSLVSVACLLSFAQHFSVSVFFSRIQFTAYFICILNVWIKVYSHSVQRRCATDFTHSPSRTLVWVVVYRASQAVGGQTQNDANVNIHIMLWKCMRQVGSSSSPSWMRLLVHIDKVCDLRSLAYHSRQR